MSLIQLLDAAKAVTGSDSATATAIGCGRGLISAVRAGDRQLAPHLASKIGELIGTDWQTGALVALAAQARTDQERGYWRGIIEKTGRVLTIAAVLNVVSFGYSKQVYSKGADDSARNIHYASL